MDADPFVAAHVQDVSVTGIDTAVTHAQSASFFGIDPTVIFISGLTCAFLLSIFFSIVKIVFASAEKSSLGNDDDRLRYYAGKISAILKDRVTLSCTVVAGKTLSNIAFATLSLTYFKLMFPHAPLFQRWAIPLVISFYVLTLITHYIPRAFAMRFYRDYIIVVYYAYCLLSWMLMPFSWFFATTQNAILKMLKYNEKLSFLSDEDKARITAGDDNAEALNDEEREMIESIFDLSETTVDEIMVPRINIMAVDIGSSLQSILALVREEGHSRFPVYKDTIDQITGVLYAKDILSWLSEHNAEEWDLSALVKKCHYVPMGKKINDLMKEFRAKHQHIAIIVDEYGGTAGMVTMEDILEEIVGDIQDEYDEEEKEVVQIDDNTYLVDPHIDLSDLNDELDLNLDEDADYNTLGGLIYHEYGDVPQEGTTFEHSGLKISILKMDNQRIDKVKIEVTNGADKTAEPF